MKIKLLFGLGGALVGGALALLSTAGIKAMRWPAALNLISRAMKERQ
jgi:hypothetical protein